MSYPGLRLSVFVAVFALCALAERAAPRRTPVASTGARWSVNAWLMLIGAAAVRLLPFAAIEAAYRAEAARFGLMNQASIWFPLKVLLTIVLLDLLVYWQHRAFHAVPALWRVHAVHHTDLDLDATSGVRFHPVEIVLSMLIKIAAVTLLGAHFIGVGLFEMILSAGSLFSHANIALPGPVDAVLRLLVVTPDMHRVHHSPSREETDSNFGFSLSWWDRLFLTYRPQPREAHESMALGLAEARDERALSLSALLARPFRRSS